MTYVIVIAALLALIAALAIFLYRSHRAPGEPLDVSGWVKVDREVAMEGGFALSGDAVNYGNGRTYKLHLKREADGSSTWYAEMVDTGEWYKTDIGQDERRGVMKP